MSARLMHHAYVLAMVNAHVILDFNWQTWAFDPASEWIIEFHHDLGWHWGKAA